MPYIGKPQSSDPITVNASNIEDGSIIAADISSSLGNAISGSLGSNASVIRTLDRTTLSGSLGANAAVIRSLDRTTLSGSLGSNAAIIRSLDRTTISGSIPQALSTTSSPTFNNITATGTLTAQEIHTEFTSASILFTSGSTIFGNSSDDVHNMTGSLNVSGSLFVKDGTLTVTDNVDFNGDLDVDGTTNLDVVDIDGAVDMASKLVVTGQITGSSTTLLGGDVNVTADGARFFVSSADYELVSIGRAGSSGGSLDQGYLRMKSAGSNKIALHTAGDSYITGGNLGIGTDSPASQLHIFSSTGGVDTILEIECNASNASPMLVLDAAADRDGGVYFQENGTYKGGMFNDASEDATVIMDGSNNNTMTLISNNATFAGNITQSASGNLRHSLIAGGSGEAVLLLQANNSTGDSFIRWETNATTFSMGFDNGDSDKFILSGGSDLHSDSIINIQPDGSIVTFDKAANFNSTVTIGANPGKLSVGAAAYSSAGSAYDFVQVGHSAGFFCETADAADRNAFIGNNIYHNGSNWRTLYEDQVSAIQFRAGTIRFNTAGVTATSSNLTTGGGDERMRVNDGGSILFGTTTRTATGVGGASFDPNSVGRCLLLLGSVNYTSEVDLVRLYNDNGEVGDIRTNGSGASFNSNSDYRLKENQVSLSNALTRLNNLKPYRFNFKADPSTTLDGFFAHEVQEVVPEAVTGTKDQMMPIQYQPGDDIPEGKQVYDVKEYSTTEIDAQKMDASKLVPLLVAALQEADDKIDALTTRIEALEG